MIWIWGVIKEGALRRNKKFLLPKENFIKWWTKQKQECFYCGVNVKQLKKINDSMASWCDRLTIDRLDNEKPYMISNLALACRRCNAIKGDFFTSQEMKEIGKKYVRPKRILK